ncbi:hypothetical protein GCK72_012369 [Caenorhabditis remanei]|uniref:Uncharacterized protein n=1 Tax=Caenorhabditis remanei TaxID=31234 RepID=A0A6A5GMY7_CAERE|nr:hypothetical protein GCK72_012369 [Caenorhabditis remanei]KAF1755916.1 hypothetical protein GCK72_012369 [Caenorhabditis remanei]
MPSPLSNIKTESRPIWEQPPPPNIVLPELPPEDPSRHITLQEYKKLACAPEIARQTWARVGQSCEAKQLLELTILHCFSEVPPLGKKRNSHQKVQDHYAIVAIKVWKRIGILYSQQIVSGCLMAAKIGLRRRLRTFTIEKRLSKEKVEEKMWEWPLYQYMRTYRQEDYEKGLRTKALKDKNGQPFVFELNDDDDKEEMENDRSVESIPADNIKKKAPAPSALKRSLLLQVKQEEEEEPPKKIAQLNTPVFTPDIPESSQNMPGPHSSHSPKGRLVLSGLIRPALLQVKQEEREPPTKIPPVESNLSESSRHVRAVSSQHQEAQYKPTQRDLPAPSRHVPGFSADVSGSSQNMSGLSSSHSPSPSHQHRVPHYDPSLQDMLSYSPEMPDPSYQQASGHNGNQSEFLKQRDPLGHHKNMSVPTALLSKTDQYYFNEDMEYLNRKLLRIHEKNETLYRAARDAVLEVTKAIERKTPDKSLESVFLELADFFKDVKVPE